MDLQNLKSKQDLKRIIIEELGYPATGDRPFPTHVKDEAKSKITGANVIAAHKGFSIVYVEIAQNRDDLPHGLDSQMRSIEREIISKTDKHLRGQYLFVFSGDEGNIWHFINARSTGSALELRRFSITPTTRNKLRTANDRLSLTKVEATDTLQSLIDKHRKAFDVEEVTMEFFRVFADKFLDLIEIITKCRVYQGNPKQISDVAQVILNRLVFLKFVEQKKWLDNSPDYLYDRYQPYFSGKGLYWQEILIPLFELLSDKDRKKYKELGDIPFLNGGLFGKEPKDLFIIPIPNVFFQDLFENLLNRFNFTIEESSPSSIEVAVDPEMLGRIFEELVLRMEKTVNKSEAEFERELRRETGSYYTPRVAVYFMCREAIARRLAAISGVAIPKVKKLIDLALDDYPDNDQIKGASLTRTQCQGLLHAIEFFSICDPAAGSGAFLLGALQILVGMKRFLKAWLGDGEVNDRNFNYSLKEETIKKNLVGVDLLQQAVHICELRLWLSLAVDYQQEKDEPIPTLPNLTYKIFHGDSIVDHLADHALEGFRYFKDFEANEAMLQRLNKIIHLKDGYFSETDEGRKAVLRQNIAKERLTLAIDILKHEAPQKISQTDLFGQSGKAMVKKTIEYIESETQRDLVTRLKRRLSLKSDTGIGGLSFVWLIDLIEFFADHGRGGFDVVIGNPPYGVKNEVMQKGRNRYGLGSDDSYGVFIAMAFQDLLKTGGILSFITSDTWQTIKTHKPLRRFLLDNSFVHYLLMMPTWLFGATVNTSILIATKSERGRILSKRGERILFENSVTREQNELIVCDFTRAEKNIGELEDNLYSLDNPEYISTPKKAYYHYPQGLIETNSNWPFFVGSPKLFALMNDTACKTIERGIGEKEKKKVKVRQIELNGKIIEIVRVGDIAEVRQGLATGDNDSYLFQNPDARGNYRSINDYLEFLLTEDDLKKISGNEKLRMKVIEKGLHKSKTEKPFDPDLWFGGRYITRYDKGGESDVESGFLPNYWVPIDYFIDWSQKALKRMRTLTIGERDGTSRNQRAAVIRSPELYFKAGVTFSFAGLYCPTFRIGSSGPFDHGSSNIFCDEYGELFQLGIFASKLQKFFARIYINHTVNYGVDDLKENPFNIKNNKSIIGFVNTIIEKQKQNPRYDYMSNEQKEIDKLVYEMYGLNADDVREVETWYARRYPKLARFCDIN